VGACEEGHPDPCLALALPNAPAVPLSPVIFSNGLRMPDTSTEVISGIKLSP